MDKLVKDFKNGYHEASIITAKTVESITADDKQTWTAFRKEMEEIGISLEAFESNKSFIIKWLRDALERGDFEEQRDDVDSGNEMFRDDSDIEVDKKVVQEHPVQKASTRIQHVEIPNAHNKTSTVVKPSQSGNLPQAAGPRRRGNRLGRLVHRLLGYDDALYQACESGNVAKVRELLEKGADPNSTKEGRSAIFVAIKTKRAAIIKLLIEKGADYKTTFFQDQFGSRKTLLCEAVVHGDLETVELLLELKADIEAAPGGDRSDNPSPLQLASCGYIDGYIEKIHLLLSHGADLNSGNDGLSPLREAISTGSLQAVELLLEKGADMHRPLKCQGKQVSALRFAVLDRLDYEAGRCSYLEDKDPKFLEIVELLLQKGANPNEPSLMNRVVRDLDVNLAKLLIEYGAKAEWPNDIPRPKKKSPRKVHQMYKLINETQHLLKEDLRG